MINLFCGFDKRESDGFSVFTHSVITRATQPVSIVPLSSMGMQQGSNAFTLSRFMVPWLMGYSGHAIFCDASDMLMLEDIAELDSLFDPQYAIQVVKHPDYKTRHRTKYRGTDMECPNSDYSRKNWASVFICNAAAPEWQQIEDKLYDMDPLTLLQLRFIPDDAIGELPDKWNRLVDEGQPVEGSAIRHFTAGFPGFKHYADAPGADAWHAEAKVAFGGLHG